MDQRWRSWTAPLAWVLTGCGAVLVASSAWYFAISDRGPTYLPAVPVGMSLALVLAVIVRVVSNPAAKDRSVLGIVAALVLAGAAAIQVTNAVAGYVDRVAEAVWASAALAVVHLVAAVSAVLVTLVWTGGEVRSQEAQPTAAALERQPSWSASQAVGASWTRAGDAATGAPAAASGGVGWGARPDEQRSEHNPSMPAEDPGIGRAVPGVPTAADWASGQPVIPPGAPEASPQSEGDATSGPPSG